MSKNLDIQKNEDQIIEPMEEELVKYHPLDSKNIFELNSIKLYFFVIQFYPL